VAGAAAGVLALLSWTLAAAHRGTAPDALVAAHSTPRLLLQGSNAEERRAAMIRRAEIRLPHDIEPLPAEPPPPSGMLDCRYLAKEADGTSAKFDCALGDGRTVKVKYGRNPEIHAETLATTLVAALGYATDRVAIVPRVRCYGCPRFPFATMQVLQFLGMGDLLAPHGFERGYTDFPWPAVEHRFPAPAIETPAQGGWAWFEIRDSEASRQDLDALRLLAVFLAHWDNKADNQRLVCLDAVASAAPANDCARPLLMMQDLGSTFGPTKLNVATWREHRIWSDRARCVVTMRDLPYHGSTFSDAPIGEEGRAQLAASLSAISEPEIRQMLTRSRVPEFQSGTDDNRDLDAWVSAFQSKVNQITQAGPCPGGDGLDVLSSTF
jgi:hypothetical protein